MVVIGVARERSLVSQFVERCPSYTPTTGDLTTRRSVTPAPSNRS